MKPPLSLAFAVGSLVLGLVMAVQMVLPHHTPPSEALFYQSDFISVPEGTLLRAEGDERVYYASEEHKRWIDSAATFSAQGFHSEDVRVISAGELARYPEGEPITAKTILVLPGEKNILPDLAPLAPYELRFGTVGGRTVIRFTGSFWNKGYRPFLLLGRNETVAAGAAEGSQEVYQHVVSSDGSVREKYVGTFVYHPAHHHQHFDNFAEYLFEPAQMEPGTKSSAPSIRLKTTFCMRDDERMPADIPDVPLAAVFTVCGNQRQAVSAGWIDVYPWTLPDQYVDVQDVPPGVYALSFALDPLGAFIEGRADNDIATTLIELDVQRKVLRVIATLSPFATLRNHIDDGTLLRDTNTRNVYVIEHGRKRWLRTEEIFSSYGYDWGMIYPITHAMADAIPSQMLVRRQGESEVYALNDRGYRLHIPNPAVFASYGFAPADIADVTDVEFAGYPVSNLIVHSGDSQVYTVSGMTKHAIGPLDELRTMGYDLNGLHVVNDTEFAAYELEQ